MKKLEAKLRVRLVLRAVPETLTRKLLIIHFSSVFNPLRATGEKSRHCVTSLSHWRREKSTEKHQPISEGIPWEPQIISCHTSPQKMAKEISFYMTRYNMMVAEQV